MRLGHELLVQSRFSKSDSSGNRIDRSIRAGYRLVRDQLLQAGCAMSTRRVFITYRIHPIGALANAALRQNVLGGDGKHEEKRDAVLEYREKLGAYKLESYGN